MVSIFAVACNSMEMLKYCYDSCFPLIDCSVVSEALLNNNMEAVKWFDDNYTLQNISSLVNLAIHKGNVSITKYLIDTIQSQSKIDNLRKEAIKYNQMEILQYLETKTNIDKTSKSKNLLNAIMDNDISTFRASLIGIAFNGNKMDSEMAYKLAIQYKRYDMLLILQAYKCSEWHPVLFKFVFTTLEDGSTVCDWDTLLWLRSQKVPFKWDKDVIAEQIYKTRTFADMSAIEQLKCMDFIGSH